MRDRLSCKIDQDNNSSSVLYSSVPNSSSGPHFRC